MWVILFQKIPSFNKIDLIQINILKISICFYYKISKEKNAS